MEMLRMMLVIWISIGIFLATEKCHSRKKIIALPKMTQCSAGWQSCLIWRPVTDISTTYSSNFSWVIYILIFNHQWHSFSVCLNASECDPCRIASQTVQFIPSSDPSPDLLPPWMPLSRSPSPTSARRRSRRCRSGSSTTWRTSCFSHSSECLTVDQNWNEKPAFLARFGILLFALICSLVISNI